MFEFFGTAFIILIMILIYLTLRMIYTNSHPNHWH